MDRISAIIIKNVRSIDTLSLQISPITVLIGENGAGKSTILECIELLHKSVDPNFIEKFYTIHGGPSALLRKGTTSLSLGIAIKEDSDQNPGIQYEFTLTASNGRVFISREVILVGSIPGKEYPVSVLLERNSVSGSIQYQGEKIPLPEVLFSNNQLYVSNQSLPPQKAISRLVRVLSNLETHLPFDTTPSWAARSYNLQQRLRGPSTHFPAQSLHLLGFNLANTWSALKNKPTQHWEYTLDLLRLGLGERVDTVAVEPDPGGGNIHLLVHFKDMREPVSISSLSDGQISWLAFVAMIRINDKRSLLAIDEPELHLHPHLLKRTIDLLTGTSDQAPVLLSTHSDRVLELIPDPADSLRVCELDGSQLVVRHLDKTQLPEWLDQFGNISEIRRQNRLEFVLEEREQK